MPLLEIKGLKTHFKTDDGWLHAVDGVDIAIDAGQTVSVVGESGCGKSVTAKTVMKLIDMPPGKIVAGQVLWQGRDLVPLPAAQMQAIRAKEIAMIFQEPMTSLNPVYPIGEQIAESVRLHEGLSRRDAMDRAVEMLRLVKIPTAERRVNDYPHQFSGGMRPVSYTHLDVYKRQVIGGFRWMPVARLVRAQFFSPVSYTHLATPPTRTPTRSSGPTSRCTPPR